MINSIADFQKIDGLEELLRCFLLVPSGPDKLLDVLELYGQSQLYQKTEYILEALEDELSLPEHFFTECEKQSFTGKTYLFEK